MKLRKRSILAISIPLVLIYVFVQGYRHSTDHVAKYNAGQPHSLNCATCHVYPQREGVLASILNEAYLSPLNMAITRDGKRMYVTAQEGDVLIIVDIENEKIISKMKVGKFPHSVVLSEDEKTAYVSNQWSYNISVIDLEKQSIVDTLQTGTGPAGMAIDKDRRLYVANTYSSDISIFDLSSGKEVRRLLAGNRPMSIALTPDQKNAVISNRRTVPVSNRSEPQTEFTIANTQNKRISKRMFFPSSHIMENVAVTPQGDLAITTLIRPKNLVPSVQIEQGWMINHGIGIIELKDDGRVAQFMLDEPNKFYPDPFDVVISPDGKTAYVSHSGADIISVIDIDKIRALLSEASEKDLLTYANHLGLSSQFVKLRIPTGPNPKGLTLSPDGSRLYIAERLADKIAVIDTRSMETLSQIDLGGPGKTSITRKGARLFQNASHTFQNQYSCYTCHPDGHEDGLVYDLTGTGRDLANVQTLRDLEGTSPFKWNGKNVSIYMQCGMRFSKFVTRTESFAPDDLDALVAYIMRDLTHPPNPYQLDNGQLNDAQKRGKEIFERTTKNTGEIIPVSNRCITCHSGPSFTNRQVSNVGTGFTEDRFQIFDSPNLNNIYESAPYLHDGRASTLEEIWTKHNDHDEHGVANDLTKEQLNDLIEYLKCLGPPRTYTKIETINSNANRKK